MVNERTEQGGEGGAGSGGGSGGGGLSDWDPDWSAVAPNWLQEESIVTTLKRFGRNPSAFVLGAVLSSILGGVEAVFVAILDSIQFVFVGDSASTTEGALGIVDIPMYIGSLLTSSGRTVGTAFLDSVGLVVSTMADTALSFGMLSPFVLAAEMGLVIVVLYYLGKTLLKIAIDAIPGGGGLL